MKFNYKVKHNGKVYPAGTDVPVEGIEPEVKKTEEVATDEVVKPTKAKTGSKKTKK